MRVTREAFARPSVSRQNPERERLNMDNQILNESDLKTAIVKVYADVVALHPNCEEGFRSLNERDISVRFENGRITIQFPCLNVQSEAANCARETLTSVSRQFFIEETTPLVSCRCSIRSSVSNLRTDFGRFSWSCKVRPVND